MRFWQTWKRKENNMEFNYLVEKKRMLDNLGCIRQTSGTCDGLECNKCPLSKCKNGYDLSCSNFEIKYSIEATEIVRKWAEEHPRKMLEHGGRRMRLIDADKLKEWITAHCDIELEPVIEELVLRVIDDQPAAYSVDGVIDNLYEDSFSLSENDPARIVSLDDAVGIVKGGGRV